MIYADGRAMREEKAGKEEVVDIFLFVLLALFAFLLTLRRIGPGGQDFSKLLQPHYLIPVALLYSSTFVLLFYRRRKNASLSPFHVVLGPLFLTYFALKLLGYAIFPWGPQRFLFGWEGRMYEVAYAGFSWGDRLSEWLSESLFLSWIYAIFLVYPSFKRHRRKLAISFLLLVVATAVFLLVCSLFTEAVEYGENFVRIFEFDSAFEEAPTADITSIVGHRNFYGFFLMTGVLALMVLSFFRPSFLWTVLALGLTLVNILVLSRTSLSLSLAGLAAILFLSPIFSFRKRRKEALANLAVGASLLLVLTLSLTALKETGLGKKVWDFIAHMGDRTTLDSRELLANASMSVVGSDLRFVLFGLGKTSFVSIFGAFQEAHGGEMVLTAHNGWLSALSTTGAIGVVFLLCLYLALLFMILSLARIRRFDLMAGLLCCGALLLAYSFPEFRMIFYVDGITNSSLVFYPLFLCPTLYAYELVKDVSSAKSRVPQKLVYPSEVS